ncbi:MAG: tRNA uridine(34) 5-carboxymethylaminomethyl modification radical SAM/GNAT enzyme Elp3, partial [Nanobdellota archaeon]
MTFYSEIIDFIEKNEPDKQKLSKAKTKLAGKFRMKKIPTDIEILLHTPQEKIDKVKRFLLTKPGRTGSGVAVVAIMSYPFRCPHGECDMCPSHTEEKVPQSYTGKEPATMRGIRNEFDAYLQVFNRLEQYIVTGHKPEKVELIIMGGTFMSFDPAYREDFIRDAFSALNTFSNLFYSESEFLPEKFREFFELPGDVGNAQRTKNIHAKIKKLKENNKETLATEQYLNESAVCRCVGLTIETRPDYGKLSDGKEMLRYGCTRVELGVQSVLDKNLENINRGHSVQDTIESTKTLKDLGFKINYHLMPGLPQVSRQEDIDNFKKVFDDDSFRPDMLKLYPCMVMKKSKLYEKWKKGEFTPLNTKNAARLISEFKKYIPAYVRVMRVQRDIPTYAIEAGVEHTNLRQFVDKLEHGCRCIRCREAGHVYSKKGILPENIKTVVRKYNASGGKEFFISLEDREKDILVGFIRLRFPGEYLTKEITKNSAIVRELHVYGDLARIGEKTATQHRGYGKRLLEKAENIAKENSKDKVIIISGVGVRSYYKKYGYKREGFYMA